MALVRLSRLVAALIWAALLCATSDLAMAHPNPGADIQRHQDTALEHTKDRVVREADLLRTTPDVAGKASIVAAETPCYEITSIYLLGAEPYPWMQDQVAVFAGQCLGVGSLRRLRDFLTLSLLERGYVTARAGYPKQNLKSGVLVIEIIPGHVAQIREEGNRIGYLAMPLATSTGRLLNQEDLDQTLENLMGLTSQADARIDLLPGAGLGETDLLIRHGTQNRWHANISIDNGGTRDTGKNQLSAGLGVDSPLGLYDNLAVSYNTNADMTASSPASRASGMQWSMPMGYYQVQLGASKSYYKQTVAGFSAPIEYTGDTRSMEIALSRVIYRGGLHKGETTLRLYRKRNRNFIDGIEIDVQTRDTAGWDFNHTHKQRSGSWSWDAGFSYRSSMPDWSKKPGVLLGVPEWDGRYSLWQVHVNASRQGQVAGQVWRYQTRFMAQEGGRYLPPAEYFSVGGRYSVRGFDGEQTLSAESGFYWRNEIALSFSYPLRRGTDRASTDSGSLGLTGSAPAAEMIAHELYLALDAGRISGPQSQLAQRCALVGTALGIRGNWGRISYEISANRPLAQPDFFVSKATTLSVAINYALH